MDGSVLRGVTIPTSAPYVCANLALDSSMSKHDDLLNSVCFANSKHE